MKKVPSLLLAPILLGLQFSAQAKTSKMDHISCETYIIKSKSQDYGLEDILRDKNYKVTSVDDATTIKEKSLYVEVEHYKRKFASNFTKVSIYKTTLDSNNKIMYDMPVSFSSKKRGNVKNILKALIPTCNIAQESTSTQTTTSMIEPFHVQSDDEALNENE